METPSTDVGNEIGIDPVSQSIYAIGLISVRFASFESILTALFANMVGTTTEFAYKLSAKTKHDIILQFIEESLNEQHWSGDIKDRVSHLVKASKIIIDSRNTVIHSNITWSSAPSVALYKSNRKGKTTMKKFLPCNLLAFARSIEMFHLYGMQLANHIGQFHINWPDSGVLVTPGLSPFPLPDKPPLPTPLN
jgi:hypothetical protein